jgi:prophage antirepressor-like protein
MTNNLTLFDFDSQSIRVLTINNEPWFVAQDICRVLEIKNVSKALSRIDEEDKGAITSSDTIGRQQNYTVINESGFYSLLLGSRKLVAKPFKRWVTKEVLPSIRKTGKYQLENNREAIADSIAFVDQSIDVIFKNVPVKPELVAGLKLNAIQQIAPQQAKFIEDSRQVLINNTAQEFKLLTATEIGEQFGISGIAANKLLIQKGYQKKNELRKSRKEPAYLPTDKGSEFSDLTLASGSGKDNTTYQQLRWYESILSVLL